MSASPTHAVNLRPRHHKGRLSAGMLAFAGFCAAPGCVFGLDAEPSFESGLPQDRFAAIQLAADTRDRSATDDLVRQLGSDDVLVRWAADDALQTITGLDAGFLPDGTEAERSAGIDRWIDLLGMDVAADTNSRGRPHEQHA